MNAKFDKIVDRYGTNSAKWDEAEEKYGKGLIHLGVADMDFESPEPIINAMQKVLGHKVFGYTVFNDNYYKKIQEWMARRFNWEVEKEWLVFCPRISVAVSIIVQTLTKENDKIIVNSPGYGPLREAVEKNNRKIILSPLKYENGRYEIDFDDLEEKVDSSVKMFILCNPHNPVGRVWTTEELKKLGEFCVRNNLVIVSDEIHADVLYKGYNHVPIASISKEIEQRTITCNAVTKTFNVPGIIISNLVIPNKEIRESIEKSIDALGMHNPNIFSVSVVEAAYTECDEWLGEVLEYIEGNYNYFEGYVMENMQKLKIVKPEGTYVIWVDYRELGLTEEEVYDWFINKAKVGVYMGTAFGEEGRGFLRINLATSRKNIKEALERIRRFYPIK